MLERTRLIDEILGLPTGAIAYRVGRALAERFVGFSFAYVKELIVSAMIRWAHKQQPGSMDALMLTQLAELRNQMVSEGAWAGR